MAKPTTKTKPNEKKHPGVYALNPRKEEGYRVRVTARHPVTKARVAREKVLLGVSLTQAVAERDALLTALQQELTTPEPTAPPPAMPSSTFASYAARWLDQKAARLRPSVHDGYLMIMGRYILPVLGHLTMAKLTRSDVLTWVTWAEQQTSARGQQYAQDTLSGWWRVLACCLRDISAELDLPDPTRRVKPPRSRVKNVTEGRALSAEQLTALLSAVKTHFGSWYCETYLMAYTGMRPSELYALTWGDIDLTEKVIHQTRSVGKLQDVNDPKTGSARDIALTDRMVALLHAHRQTLLREQHRGLHSGLVFPSVSGEHRLASALFKTLRLAGAVAKLPVKVGPKTLRKTFITLAALQGSDRLAIRSNVGHCSEEMTERYAWVSPDEKRKVVEGIEQMTGQVG